MSSFDLPDLIPPQPPFGQESARAQLRREFKAEKRRTIQIRMAQRLGVITLVVSILMGITPATPNPELAPLLGLADALESSAASGPAYNAVWYLRSDQRSLVIVPSRVVPQSNRSFRFVLPSVEERWVLPGGTGGRRVVYGNPTFFSGVDEGAFYALGLMYYYPVGRVVNYPFEDTADAKREWSRDPDTLLAELSADARGQQQATPQQLLSSVAKIMSDSVNAPTRRSVMLRALARIPGIEVSSRVSSFDVYVRYVEAQVPYELRLTFEAESGQLTRQAIWRLATTSAPGVLVYESSTVGSRWDSKETGSLDPIEWSFGWQWGSRSDEAEHRWEDPPWDWRGGEK